MGHLSEATKARIGYLRRQSLLRWAAMVVVLVGTSWRYPFEGFRPLPVAAVGLSLLPGLMW